MSNRSVSTPDRAGKTPSEIANRNSKLCQDLEALRTFMRNHIQGGYLKAPTTSSAQLTGSGNTTFNVNYESGLAVVDGVAASVPLKADLSIHAGSNIGWAALTTKSCVAAVVAKSVSGVITLVAVKGTVDLDADAVGPTDAVIQAAVGAGNPWVKVGETTLERTADTTVVQTYDNTKRPILCVNEDSQLGDWS